MSNNTVGSMFSVMRGIRYASYANDEKRSLSSENLTELADTFKKKNQSGTTKVLKDMTEDYKWKNGDIRTHFSSGNNTSDVFGSEYGEFFLIENGDRLSQDDLLTILSQENGGIKYADRYTDYTKEAINFAKADIGLIEKSNFARSSEVAFAMDWSDVMAISSDEITEAKQAVEDLDIDNKKSFFMFGDKSLNPKEYASYLLLADGLSENNGNYSYDENKLDGLITPEEVEGLTNLSDEQIKSMVTDIYNNIK